MDSLCVRRYASQHNELVDDQAFVNWPHRIGRSYLLYGRKRSHFPYQMFVSVICSILKVVWFDRHFEGGFRLALHVHNLSPDDCANYFLYK